METTPIQAIKLAVMAATDLSRDALHVHLGLVVFFVAAAMARRRLHSPWPWLAALAACLFVEAVDLHDDLLTRGHLRWGASAHDLVNTMVWPTVLAWLARRGWCERRRAPGTGGNG